MDIVGGFFRAMAALIEYPFLAIVPIALFSILFYVSKSRFALIAAILWLAYLPYEYSMKLRILCSGDCNIRIDLLVLYPVLLAASVAGMVAFIIRVRKNA